MQQNLIDIVTEFENLVSQVDVIIAESGYKLGYIAKRLGMSRNNLYLKRRNNTFTIAEVKAILEIARSEAHQPIGGSPRRRQTKPKTKASI